ncbi:MAG: hypothetical protein ABIR29_01785 [Chthoniobacterales bacterium]
MKRSQKTPVEDSSAKTTLPDVAARKVIAEHHYRCPACGAQVDSRDREETARHHRHVLFPKHFDRRREGASEKTTLPPGTVRR